jgi:hypothetical protein
MFDQLPRDAATCKSGPIFTENLSKKLAMAPFSTGPDTLCELAGRMTAVKLDDDIFYLKSAVNLISYQDNS